ncbi:ribosome assembly protein SQT1 [Geosmithia morbida]|uniref:Ribosome assembly protein SQT1 n=1 Tax=Geosmithia morbida TaxID=1094350 RepID=A0A9P5D5C4_9HYPO|nr:ribosome assembly protein SQT1 [Geosmithia morbida]KAF4124411.1 ribosome assembly protein SQT1 [Geosmithia morbida]
MSHQNGREEDLDDMLAADEAAEEIEQGDDIAMDSEEDGDGGGDDDDDDDGNGGQEELVLHNDSIGYFDEPQDSLFSIAQHPIHSSLVAVGGAAGSDEDAPGAGFIVDTSSAPSRPVLPASYAADPASASGGSAQGQHQLKSLFSIEGHTDSINALTWTLPHGEVLVSGGLDGRIRAWRTEVRPGEGVKVSLIGEAEEVPEVNWLQACPSPANPNTVALGASDGSVWVYTIDPTDEANPLQIVQSYFLHTMPCTAGCWTPDGQLLATVSEDSSLYVWDVWGQAAARGLTAGGDGGTTVVSQTGEDQRFEVPGGLYSVAVDPKGGFVAAGGAGGVIKIVSLPRLTPPTQSRSQARGAQRGNKASSDSAGGQILASLQAQSDSVESLAISMTSASPPTVLLAAGSVDGSICVYDATRRFAVRRHLVGAHEEHSVVKVEFVRDSWLLTSCGMDGVVRRWDLRGSAVSGPGASSGAGTDNAGLLKEWRGHRGDGEGGGVLGFVQGETGSRIITAGDDSIALVFEA